MPQQENLWNPLCKCGRRMRKNGTYKTKKFGIVQRFRCLNCGKTLQIPLRKWRM